MPGNASYPKEVLELAKLLAVSLMLEACSEAARRFFDEGKGETAVVLIDMATKTARNALNRLA